MIEHIFLLITTIISGVSTGGWFISWRWKRADIQIEVYRKIISDLEGRVVRLQDRQLDMEKEMDLLKKLVKQ
jgi:hypothetical protein